MESVINFILDNFIFIVPIFVIFILSSFLINRILYLAFEKIDLSTASFISSLFQFLILFSFLPFILWYFDFDKTKIWAIVAILSTASALALTSKINDLFSGLVIYVMRFYRINDKVTLNSIKGKVIEFNTLNTVLLTRDGDIVTINNSSVINKLIINHSQNKTQRIVIKLGFQNYPNKEQLIKEIIKIVNKQKIVSKPEFTQVHYGVDNDGEFYEINFFVSSSLDVMNAKGLIMLELCKIENFDKYLVDRFSRK